jgi:hypothetical protein
MRVAKVENRISFFDFGISNTHTIAIRAIVSTRSVDMLIASIVAQKANWIVVSQS